MSTDLPSVDEFKAPSSSSSAAPELGDSSVDIEDWVDWVVPCVAATELVVDGNGVVERLSEMAVTVSDTDDDRTAEEELAAMDSDIGSSNADDITSDESDDFASFSACFAASTAELLFAVPLLLRTETPDDVVEVVTFDMVEATTEQVGGPCEPVVDRVVV